MIYIVFALIAIAMALKPNIDWTKIHIDTYTNDKPWANMPTTTQTYSAFMKAAHADNSNLAANSGTYCYKYGVSTVKHDGWVGDATKAEYYEFTTSDCSDTPSISLTVTWGKCTVDGNNGAKYT